MEVRYTLYNQRLGTSETLDKGATMKSELTKIPGIGEKMAQHLTRAGFPTIESLKGKCPDDIYAADCIT